MVVTMNPSGTFVSLSADKLKGRLLGQSGRSRRAHKSVKSRPSKHTLLAHVVDRACRPKTGLPRKK